MRELTDLARLRGRGPRGAFALLDLVARVEDAFVRFPAVDLRALRGRLAALAGG